MSDRPSALIPVANQFGWTSSVPNQITCRWLEYCRQLGSPYTIDIGAGLGVASIPALELGAHVIANDIAEDQLQNILLSAKQRNVAMKLSLMHARMPDLPQVQELDAVHASNVFHFLKGGEMVTAANWMYAALKPRGKVFLQTLSPFAGHFKRFLQKYESRRAEGLMWPGEMDAKCYAESEILGMTPDFVHVLESEKAMTIFKNAGFEIDYCEYYTRTGLPDICRFDGRENLGVVATKP